jgi:hypothetical protein
MSRPAAALGPALSVTTGPSRSPTSTLPFRPTALDHRCIVQPQWALLASKNELDAVFDATSQDGSTMPSEIRLRLLHAVLSDPFTPVSSRCTGAATRFFSPKLPIKLHYARDHDNPLLSLFLCVPLGFSLSFLHPSLACHDISTETFIPACYFRRDAQGRFPV